MQGGRFDPNHLKMEKKTKKKKIKSEKKNCGRSGI